MRYLKRVRRTTRTPELDGSCHVAVDATGMGRPVVDLLRVAGLGATMLPATITGGAAESLSKGYYGAPKRDPSTGLQVAVNIEYPRRGWPGARKVFWKRRLAAAASRWAESGKSIVAPVESTARHK